MASPKPIDYDLQALTQDLVALMSQLSEGRMREIGWIETAYVRVAYSDPKVVADVGESTRRLGAALCVLYFVVMIESYFPSTYKDANGSQRNLWAEVRDHGWLSEQELDKLRAYKHVRHSFAHSPDGTRANQNASSFDRVASAGGLPCISTKNNRIVVESSASIRMVDEIHSILQRLLSRMMSSPTYGAKPIP